MLQVTEKILRDTQWFVNNKMMVAIANPYFVVEQDRIETTFSLVGLDPALVQPDTPTQSLIKVLEGLGIAYCDLTPDLREAYAKGEVPYFVYDGHWNRKGHQIVGKTISTCLKNR